MPRILSSLGEPSPELLADVKAIREAGGMVALPTESSYALCVSPFHHEAVQRLCELKGGRQHKPILVLIGHPAELELFTDTVSPVLSHVLSTLMRQFWPGPLTIVVPAKSTLPTALTAGTGTVGLRVPPLAPLASLLQAVGPMTGTSANRSGAPPLMTAEDVARSFGQDLEAIVDCGAVGGGPPSTVVEVVGQELRVIRAGPVTEEQLARCIAGTGARVASA